MKISFIEPHLKLFGGIRRIIEISNRLLQRDHDVTIFHSDGSPCDWMDCRAKIRSAQQVLEEEHDVLIYNEPSPEDFWLAKRAKARLKLFYVLDLPASELLIGHNARLLLPPNRRARFFKASLKSPYLKLSNASWLVEWLRDNLAVDSSPVIGGINTSVFHPIKVKKNPNSVQILCSGDPRERKGTETVFEAISIASEEVPQITLETYYGKGLPQTEMALAYSSADLFVDGQWRAGWNNPVAEAMACQVPVVCTDIGGVRDFALHEETALLVPPRDPLSMASAIIRLVQDGELRERLRMTAYRRILQFEWEKTVDDLEKTIQDVMDHSSPYISHRYNLEELLLLASGESLFFGNKLLTAIQLRVRSLMTGDQ